MYFCSGFKALIKKYNEKNRSLLYPESTNTGTVESVQDGPGPEVFRNILNLNKARIGNSEQIVWVTNEKLRIVNEIIIRIVTCLEFNL